MAALLLVATGGPLSGEDRAPLSAKDFSWATWDITGGGMVDVQGNLAVVGHMEPPFATSIIDVADPAHPRVICRIPVRPGHPFP